MPRPFGQYVAAHGPTLEAALTRAITAAVVAQPASPLRFIAESLTNPAPVNAPHDAKPFADHVQAVEDALADALCRFGGGVVLISHNLSLLTSVVAEGDVYVVSAKTKGVRRIDGGMRHYIERLGRDSRL